MKYLSLLAALLLSACGPSAPAAYTTSGVAVAEPYSRPAPANGTGAGFFTLTNHNGPDVLVAVESPISAKVQIHESSVTGGMMRMVELKDGVPLKAGASVVFKPGGKHVMFIGLNQALRSGDRVPATLVFAKAGRVPIELTVRDGVSGGMAGMDHHNH